MRIACITVIVLATIGCLSETMQSELRAAPPASAEKSDTSQKENTKAKPKATLKPLTAEQQSALLKQRVKGSIGYTFRQFANMFLVSSRLQLGTGVGLMTPSKEISEIPLLSPFPASYKPTLREFLDSIALQTYSKWKYDPSSQYFESDLEHKEPVEGMAIFEFTKTKRKKPFEVTLAKDWKANDEGTWMMYVPPSFRVGMDIYEMGTYSTDKKPADPQFFNKIRLAVALEWAQRMNPKATKADLKPAKVGRFEALYYESMVPSVLKKDIKWRQWVFMDGNQCYFIVSTILPEMEDKIYPDVKQMLASFKIRKKETSK